MWWKIGLGKSAKWPFGVEALGVYGSWRKPPRIFCRFGTKVFALFFWTAKVQDALVTLDRARRKLEEITPGCTTWAARLKADPIV